MKKRWLYSVASLCMIASLVGPLGSSAKANITNTAPNPNFPLACEGKGIAHVNVLDVNTVSNHNPTLVNKTIGRSNGSNWAGYTGRSTVIGGGPGQCAVNHSNSLEDICALSLTSTAVHAWYDSAGVYHEDTSTINMGGEQFLSIGCEWGDATHLDVFAVGADHNLYHNLYVQGVGWMGWGGQPYASNNINQVTSCSWGAGRVDVFVTVTNNSVYHQYLNNGAWSGFEWIPNETVYPPANMSCTAGDEGRPANYMDLFVVGSVGDILHQWWDGANWQPHQAWGIWFESLGGNSQGNPNAGVSADWFDGGQRLDVFATHVAPLGGGVGQVQVLDHKWWYNPAPGWSGFCYEADQGNIYPNQPNAPAGCAAP